MRDAFAERPALPHEPPMHWLDRAELMETGDGKMAVKAFRRIEAGHPFVRRGRLECAALIEMMAQTAAAGCVLRAGRDSRKLVIGYLAAIRELKIHGPANAGECLVFTCVEEKTFGALTQGYLEARRAKPEPEAAGVIATARMTFHLEFE